jgi:hypothetical protein
MWSLFDQVDLFLITTNSTLKKNGALVMGRGVARQARDRFPNLDLKLGEEIAGICGHLGTYHLLISPRYPAAKLGAFQVKHHFRQPASLDLIAGSVRALQQWCATHPNATVALNYPGIGNGNLKREQVQPLISQLPDTVQIWQYAQPTKQNR